MNIRVVKRDVETLPLGDVRQGFAVRSGVGTVALVTSERRESYVTVADLDTGVLCQWAKDITVEILLRAEVRINE